MTKKNVMITLDEDLHRKAKSSLLNISGEVERALRLRLAPSKKDVPEDALKMKCMQCFKEIDYGFLCEERNLFLCQECQDNFDMSKCPHIFREHSHIRVPGFNGSNSESIEKIKEITNKVEPEIKEEKTVESIIGEACP